MALDGTYSGLKASVADFLNRADLTAAIPDFIVLAESQMARRFVTRARQGQPVPRRLVIRSDAAITQGQEYVAVPSDLQGPLSLRLEATPEIALDYLEPESLQAEINRNCLTGAPAKYSVIGGEFRLFPVADQAYSAELTYIARVAPLTDAAPNWILTEYPDAYLYGALLQAAPYLKDDGRVATWGTFFTAAIEDISNSDPMPTNRAILRSDIPVRPRGPASLTSC